eukprot:478357_1
MNTNGVHQRADISMLDQKVVTCSKRFFMFMLSILIMLIIIVEFMTKNVTEDLTLKYRCNDNSFRLFCSNNQTGNVDQTIETVDHIDEYSYYVNPFYWIIGGIIGALLVVLIQISVCMTNTKMQGFVVLFGFIYCFGVEIGLNILELYCQSNAIKFPDNINHINGQVICKINTIFIQPLMFRIISQMFVFREMCR